MSEDLPALPRDPAAVPARPPSPPSRLPLAIWAVIAVFCLIMFGTALGLFLWSRDSLGSRDLKKATAIKITYALKAGTTKSVEITDPAAVKDLLDALVITDARSGVQYGINSRSSVEFTLANGEVTRIVFVDNTQLDRANWGAVFVTPAFRQKVNEAATRTEGRPIDILRQDN